MKHIKRINEYNTENDDHKVNQNVNINNDKKFGEPTPTTLPLDYFGIPDEDGEIDDEDYYSTSAGRDGLYHGTEPGSNKGTKSRKTAIYKMSAESINVQDIMSFPTFVTRTEKYKNILQPYYDIVKSNSDIEDLTNILDEKIDDRIGFSFIMNYEKIYIIADNKPNLLINHHLLPLNNPDDLFDIIIGEL